MAVITHKVTASKHHWAWFGQAYGYTIGSFDTEQEAIEAAQKSMLGWTADKAEAENYAKLEAWARGLVKGNGKKNGTLLAAWEYLAALRNQQ